MLKILLTGAGFVVLGSLGTSAQPSPIVTAQNLPAQDMPAQDMPAQDMPAKDSPANGGAGIRTGNITATGATVPNPGASQSSGTTAMDRGIQQEDTKIQSSICKGC